MSFTIYYTSTRSVTPEEADTIRSAVEWESQGRSWLSSEPPSFFPDLEDGKLMGGSKPNFAPHPDDKRSAQSSGSPDAGPRDVIEILAKISRQYAIDWELMHDFGPVGFIRGGLIDPAAIAQIEALGGLAGLMSEPE